MPLSPCGHPGCPVLLPKPGKCPEHKVSRQRGRATKKDKRYNGKRWAGVRRTVFRRDPFCANPDGNWACSGTATIVDHIVPAVEWCEQGHDFFDLTNLQGLCRSCHGIKSGQERARLAGREDEHDAALARQEHEEIMRRSLREGDDSDLS